MNEIGTAGPVRLEPRLKARAARDWSIGETARRAQIPASTIRFYERRGLMPPPLRRSGQRRYDSDALARLFLIRQARAAGLNLREIAAVLRSADESSLGEAWREAAILRVGTLDRALERLKAVRAGLVASLECRCRTPAHCPLIISP